MNQKLIVLATALLFVLASLPGVSSAESQCDISAGLPLDDALSDTDGGTKPNARVTATVVATSGYFILSDSIETSSNGTRRGSGSTTSVEPHPEITGVLEPIAAISASFTQSCKHRNIFGTSSCTAAASITARQYPLDCLPELILSEINKEEQALD